MIGGATSDGYTFIHDQNIATEEDGTFFFSAGFSSHDEDAYVNMLGDTITV